MTQNLVQATQTMLKYKQDTTNNAYHKGRVVGISADENKMLLNLLQTVQNDSNYATISSSEAFGKLIARYNKN